MRTHKHRRPFRATLLASVPTLLAALALSATTGCAAFSLDPPAGFAEAQDYDHHVRMKGSDNVGLTVKVYDNVRGGTLAFWAEDMVKKFGLRGYHLEQQTPVVSKNGKTGTRFDFGYTSRGDEKRKFYTIALFVTDKYRTVVAIAGDAHHATRFRGQFPTIIRDVTIRGCKLGSKICGGAQPGKLETVLPPGFEEPEGETPEDAAPAEEAPPPAEPPDPDAPLVDGTPEPAPAKAPIQKPGSK